MAEISEDIRLSAVPMGLPRIGAHLLPTLAVPHTTANLVGMVLSRGASPNRDFLTVPSYLCCCL